MIVVAPCVSLCCLLRSVSVSSFLRLGSVTFVPSVFYQSNLTPNCTCRGSYAFVIVPKVAALRLAAGAVKFTRSNWVKLGPRTLLRGALPNGWLGSVGIDTHAVLNQLVIDCWPSAAYGSHVM